MERRWVGSDEGEDISSSGRCSAAQKPVNSDAAWTRRPRNRSDSDFFCAGRGSGATSRDYIFSPKIYLPR